MVLPAVALAARAAAQAAAKKAAQGAAQKAKQRLAQEAQKLAQNKIRDELNRRRDDDQDQQKSSRLREFGYASALRRARLGGIPAPMQQLAGGPQGIRSATQLLNSRTMPMKFTPQGVALQAAVEGTKHPTRTIFILSIASIIGLFAVLFLLFVPVLIIILFFAAGASAIGNIFGAIGGFFSGLAHAVGL